MDIRRAKIIVAALLAAFIVTRVTLSTSPNSDLDVAFTWCLADGLTFHPPLRA